MKKHAVIITVLLVLSLLCGCGKSVPAVGAANPVRESTPDEILAEFGAPLTAPEGAQDAAYGIIDGKMKLAQLSFTLDGTEYNCRMARAEEYVDISGMYYDWDSVSLLFDANDYEISFNDGAEGFIAWYDEDSGLVRSVSVGSGATSQTLLAAAQTVFPAETDAADAAAAQKLTELYGRIFTEYYPGTAGSSLRAAAFAAELADLFAGSSLTPAQVERVTLSYVFTIHEMERNLFTQQMDAVKAAFGELRTESGKGLLEDCGYESAYYPWDDARVGACFDAIPVF